MLWGEGLFWCHKWASTHFSKKHGERVGVRWKKETKNPPKKTEHFVMLIFFPQSTAYQSLLSVYSTLPGEASITTGSSITGRKHQAVCKWLKCTHASGQSQPHPFLTLTRPSPPAAHTVSVCAIKAVGWNTKLKDSAGKEQPATVALVVSCHGVWGGWWVTSLW